MRSSFLSQVILAFAFTVTTAACGGGDDVPQSDLPYLLRCDITTSGCQRDIYASVAAMLETDGSNIPPIRTISMEQFEQEVRGGASEDDLAGDDPITRGLRLMGFIPEEAGSLTETRVDYTINNIAAYYGGGGITVIDREYEDVNAQTILAHEFIHVIQDRQFGISNVHRRAEGTDGFMATRCVIEGDAVHSSFSWAYQQLGYDLDEIDWVETFRDNQARAKERAADSEVALMDTASSFPYSFGPVFMSDASSEDGLAGRASVFESPPQSVLAVLRGYRAVVAETVPPIDAPTVAHPSPIPDQDLALEDRYGAWYVYGTLRRLGLADNVAWLGAQLWVGDDFAVFEGDQELAAVWRIRFGQVGSFVASAVNESDRAVAWSAVAEGTDVFIIAAESEPALASWEAQPLEVMAAALAASGDVRKGKAGPRIVCRPPRFSPPVLAGR